jgi:hypothetical protein
MAKNIALILLTGGSSFCGLLLLPELFYASDVDWRISWPWLVLVCIVSATFATLVLWIRRLRPSTLLAIPHAALAACMLWLAINCIRVGNYDGVTGLTLLAMLVLCPAAAAAFLFQPSYADHQAA